MQNTQQQQKSQELGLATNSQGKETWKTVKGRSGTKGNLTKANDSGRDQCDKCFQPFK